MHSLRKKRNTAASCCGVMPSGSFRKPWGPAVMAPKPGTESHGRGGNSPSELEGGSADTTQEPGESRSQAAQHSTHKPTEGLPYEEKRRNLTQQHTEDRDERISEISEEIDE